MMSEQDTRQFLVFGNTFAASMTVLALSKTLPKNVTLLWIRPTVACPSDILYGGISSPEAYQFNLQYGVTEPELILNTDTTFSFGSHFKDWGDNKRTWMQCFHLPFTATSGVDLHHFLTRHNAALGDFLISAQAAKQGTFAHPPVDNPKSPLSRAEYAYHFDPEQWSSICFNQVDKTRVKVVNDDIESIKSSQNNIEYVQLKDGSKLQADLYLDCGGTNSPLLSSVDNSFECQRIVQISSKTQANSHTGPACRLITGTEFGWQSVTPLRDKDHVVSLFESSLGFENEGGQTFELGHRNKAWRGNCVGIGHAAYALEPISTAPYILLKKDIERLLELIPVSQDTKIESQQYNNRFQDDVSHAELFHRALYAKQRDVGYAECEKLDRKLTQYYHRGILTSYDFEPFNEQDWAILHAGLGRRPKHYNRMAEQVDFEKMQSNLDSVRVGIAHLASKMPPHHIYLNKLSMYLRENENLGK
jgi:tryptophan halogenase